MSKKPKSQKQTGNTGIVAAPSLPANASPLAIRYPVLWLALASLFVYLPSLQMGFTDLDDGIFINDQHVFNEKLSNVITAFSESVMVYVDKDIYYRPIYNISLILNNQLSGQEIAGYHAINILLHLLAVAILYLLLLKTGVSKLHSFLLSLFFGIHPALVMAVSWIPGRTDVILAIFAFAFLIQSINYSVSGKPRALFLSGLWLLLAFFAKESAVFLLPVAFIVLVFIRQKKWNDRNNLTQYGIWILCFSIWFVMRSQADVAAMNIPATDMIKSMPDKLPVLLQYIGKTFLPIALSTFPNVRDTALLTGIVGTILLVLAINIYRQRDIRIAGAGLGIFVVCMLPLLLIPATINRQSFEYRLYLPMLGLLLVLPQTALLRNKLTDKQMLAAGIALCGILAFLNVRHQKNFASPYAFWHNAVLTAPHDSYAHMMLSARVDDPAESKQLIETAYALNPRERYVNYILATMLQEKDSIAASEKYLLAEKSITGYAKCDLLLARVARQREDYTSAINYVNTYLKTKPADTIGNMNLLLLCMEADRDAEAVSQANHMDSLQLPIPPIIRSQIKYGNK